MMRYSENMPHDKPKSAYDNPKSGDLQRQIPSADALEKLAKLRQRLSEIEASYNSSDSDKTFTQGASAYSELVSEHVQSIEYPHK
jgi:hypothetical protein